MLAIIPSSQAEIASLKQQGVCHLMHQRMIEGTLSGVVVRIDKIPVLLPLCHFFFFFTLIYLLWKEVRKFSITYIYIYMLKSNKEYCVFSLAARNHDRVG